MLIVLAFYFLVVWLVFSKFKLLPWNKAWKTVVYSIATIIALVVVGALQYYTPSSRMAVVQNDAQKIFPLVGGRVIEVLVEGTARVSAGEVLFRLDPKPFQYTVNERKAALELARIKLRDTTILVEKNAAPRASLDQYQAELEQSQARYDTALFELENSVVVSPHDGIISLGTLYEGEVLRPMTPVMNLIHNDNGRIAAAFKQNGQEKVHRGTRATVIFSTMPGHIFETQVSNISLGTIGGQLTAQNVGNPLEIFSSSTDMFPVNIKIPEQLSAELRPGTEATVTVFTEDGHPINILAEILQYIATWMNYIF